MSMTFLLKDLLNLVDIDGTDHNCNWKNDELIKLYSTQPFLCNSFIQTMLLFETVILLIVEFDLTVVDACYLSRYFYMTAIILWLCYGSVKCIVSSPVTKGHVRYCCYLAFVVIIGVSKGLHLNLLLCSHLTRWN